MVDLKERNRNLRRRYGLNLVEFERLKMDQGNCCAICKLAGTKTDELVVDHSHSFLNSRLRGLIHRSCNARLAWYERYRGQIKHYLRENSWL